MRIQGVNFSMGVPQNAVDHSIYCITLPEHGAMPPSLTIREADCTASIDLIEELDKIAAQLSEADKTCVKRKATIGQNKDWDYAIQVIEWGPEEARIWQKNLLIHVPEKTSVFTFTMIDFLNNMQHSEPEFNRMLRDFKYPNAAGI